MIHITKLEKTLRSRLDAELVSSCGILGICISYKSKHIDAFKADSEYMFHSWGNNEDGDIDIFWGHYDLTISEALSIWKDKINQNPAGKRW
jgi:hypothetical protein